MKILVIGATGTIGKSIHEYLKEKKHTVYAAHRSSTTYPVDISDKNSIDALFSQLPQLDAVINASGTAVWKHLSDLNEEDYMIGINSKLLGQINIVHTAEKYLKNKGAIVLTTGILGDHYEKNTVALSMVNGALHSFVNAASNEISKNITLNIVAPGAIQGNFPKDKKFADHYPVAIDDVVKIYEKAIHTSETGKILKIY
ncbi:short chain dehydrogenase [Aquimarina sp. TRL1]|uniref:short chain dehydrogenase n=1 Tax=Aquimarina sp. (strain TRL1) TaxID=2736252 RepID=UPI00158CB9F0|nr:short chain dehydrogenase [Aquimarina sp. TRL1]QKX06579.1 short chain dehydrogenase [Aquimarina sp. TRL1]